MTVDQALISKLEKLARLQLSEDERNKLQTDLNNILAMVAKLEELDTQQIEPLSYISEEVNVLRDDQVDQQLDRDIALANAPDRKGPYFKVPKVIDLGKKG